MEKMTIEIQNWKRISALEVVRVIRKALFWAIKMRMFDEQQQSLSYDDSKKSGVELYITWK